MQTDNLEKKLSENSAVVCVVGQGYVGLPLNLFFAKSGLKSIGFDINREKISLLKSGKDTSGEVGDEALKGTNAQFTSDPKAIAEADFIIVCVPTPVNKDREPDISFIESTAETIGKNIKPGSIVVLESTVYPGVTEEVLGRTIENVSGLKVGKDFSLGYSPERINPGDREHTVDKIVKVVSGHDKETTEILEKLYSRIIKAGIFRARDIKTAEAAKVIENIQRDLNIALVNELALIFEKLGIDVYDVLEAAGTKWNFHKYYPGLVGGHCIPVDPYYLVHKSREAGYEPKVILAGREINNHMPIHTAKLASDELKKQGKKPEGSRILLLGLTFKKNVKDVRNTPAKVLIDELKKHGAEVSAIDPHLERGQIEKLGATPEKIGTAKGFDCVIMVTDHDAFSGTSLGKLKAASSGKPILIDTRAFFNPGEAKSKGFAYRRF